MNKVLKGEIRTQLDIRPRTRKELWSIHIDQTAFLFKKSKRSLDLNEKVLFLIRIKWGLNFIFIPGDGIRLYQSNDKFWMSLPNEVIKMSLRELFQNLEENLFGEKEKEKVNEKGFVTGWVKWYKESYPFFISKKAGGGLLEEEQLKKDRLVATPDGVIDLQNRMVLEASPQLLVMRLMEKSLKTATMSEQVQSYFYQLGGWNLTLINIIKAIIKISALPEQFSKLSFVPFLYSQGGTGKTTFLKLLEKIRGPEAIRLSIENLTSSTFSKQSMVGKKLIIFDEVNSTSLTPARLALIKTMISGDPVQLEIKYKDPESIENTQLIMVGNRPFTNEQAPEAVEDSGWRRINLCLRCESPYGLLPKDDDIDKKVLSELHLILPWALSMPNELISKLGKHAGVVSEWSEINSITPPYGLALKQWLSNYVRWDRGSNTLCGYVGSPKADSLKLAFNEYCESNEIPIPKSRSAFKSNLERSLTELGLEGSKGVYGTKGKSGWVMHGLTLDQTRGMKIEFKSPEVWDDFYRLEILTSLDKNGQIQSFLYKGSSSNNAIKPPNFVDLKTRRRESEENQKEKEKEKEKEKDKKKRKRKRKKKF